MYDMAGEKGPMAMPGLGAESQAMDPMLRRILLMRALGQGGMAMPQQPNMSPWGAAAAGFGRGLQMGGGLAGIGDRGPQGLTGGKEGSKPTGLFGWLQQQLG